MTIRLLLRKRFRKLRVNSKGFSSVIGTTFMVLVMMFLGTSVFLWTLSQNTMYNEAVRTRGQEEADRRSEGVVVLGGNYSVSGDNVTVLVVLKNAGSVAAQIINLWVLDTNQSRYANKPLNLNLNPGDVEPSWLTVTIPGADPSHDFVSWFVTARGNTVPLEKEEEGVIVAQLAQGIGSMAMEFYTFRYFEYDDNDELEDYPTGNSGFNVPQKMEIAIGVVLTNLDPAKKTITLDLYSQVWLYFPAVPGVPAFVWYVVSETNGTISTPYSEISIPYGETKLIVFASEEPGGFTKVEISHGQLKGNALGAINLLLHGKLGDRDYGQNIPFVSLYCYET